MSHASAATTAGSNPGFRPPLLLHSLAPVAREARHRRAGATTLFSVLAHAGLVVGVIVVPLLGDDAVPESAATSFFAPPLQLDPAPPPPPPPPTDPRTAVRPAPRGAETPSATLMAPVDVPAEIRPEEGLDLGLSGGTEGGVKGGVPGGVAGAVVGGLPLSTAPPAPPPAPVRAGGRIQRPVKIRNVPPEYPDLARQAGVEGVVILECTLSPQGRVTEVLVLRGIPLLDDAAIEAVRQWVYTPTLLNEAPVPVIMTVTVDFRIHGRR
jgi:protein TonB